MPWEHSCIVLGEFGPSMSASLWLIKPHSHPGVFLLWYIQLAWLSRSGHLPELHDCEVREGLRRFRKLCADRSTSRVHIVMLIGWIEENS